MHGSALLCRRHPRRQGHGAGLRDANLPDVGAHHFTTDVCGSPQDRGVFRNPGGACLSRNSACEHDHCKQHPTFHGTTPSRDCPIEWCHNFFQLPENPRALFNYLWATARRKLHRRLGNSGEAFSRAPWARTFASRADAGCPSASAHVWSRSACGLEHGGPPFALDRQDRRHRGGIGHLGGRRDCNDAL
jgi:hypothetical protein